MNNLHRVFIAISLPDKLKKDLFELQYQYPDLPARWTKMENLHITLAFLGNTNDQEICDIVKIAQEVCLYHEPFDLTLNRICYGPIDKLPSAEGEARLWRPRMVWVVGKKSPELGSLQKDLESALFEFSGGQFQEKEDYSFAPHITLARLEQAKLRQMEQVELPMIDKTIDRTFLVESIEIMESELRRGGPKYTVLENIKLGK